MIENPYNDGFEGFFERAFQALTNHSPMRWQCRLYEQMIQSRLPNGCDLPTGLGKTSVIPIWLIALASQAGNESGNLPRRLIYIVNRRTVVDQATNVVEQMRNRLLNPKNPIWETHSKVLEKLANELRKRSSRLDDLPLAISTLRGELADNEEWKADPARPAVIIGTIDMIGSKLLFSGYGDGRYYRPHHAGLIGQDSLIIHDEAHLTPAFSDLLHSVVESQRQTHERRPVQVLELSATTRGNSDVLTLEPEDDKDKIVHDRLNAKKSLQICAVASGELVDKLTELAHKHEATPSKVLIYVRSPESAQKIVDAFGKQLGKSSASRIALLTGTIRGHERNKLVQANPVYRAFLDHDSKVQQTVYLVSTSAGEVGIDLDADNMICDLATLDSMIQRLGRVNRRGGEGRAAMVDVVVPQTEKEDEKDKEFEQAVHATQTILVRLPSKDDSYDASPNSLCELLKSLDEGEKKKAFSPKPAVQPLTDILLDAWSFTSINTPMSGRPEVAPFLHGLTNDPPETHVVWRKEVALLHEAGVDEEALHDWFRACQIETHERLRDRTDRVKKALQTLLEKHREKDQNCDFPVVILNERGDVEFSNLSKIVEKEFNLAYRTLVLPAEVGGLTPQGVLDGKIIVTMSDIDVAEATATKNGEARRERWLLTEAGDSKRWERLLTGETLSSPPSGLRELERITLQTAPEGAEKDMEIRHLVLMASLQRSSLENPEIARIEQTLKVHSGHIESYVKCITKALELDRELENALVTAAQLHDNGKNRGVWQRFACNTNPKSPLAKSKKYLHGRALGGYRHEFGSLIEATMSDALKNHPERDLVLYLISAHHGWGRPHFENSAWDHAYTSGNNQEAAVEVMRRFGRLQQRFGRWSLAWLESLLRCADIAASKESALATVPLPAEGV